MRCLIHATLPVEAGNALVRDPNFEQRLQSVVGELQPEAVYFATANGQRTIYAICELASGADIPRVCEPLWLAFNAAVEVIPVLTPDDMQQAVAHVSQAAQKFG